MRVLREPKNALTKQYERLFAMEDARLSFTDDALQAIAERAQERDTGARGLRSIIENIMMDIMFELPEQGSGNSYEITENIVAGQAKLFPMSQPKNKSA